MVQATVVKRARTATVTTAHTHTHVVAAQVEVVLPPSYPLPLQIAGASLSPTVS